MNAKTMISGHGEGAEGLVLTGWKIALENFTP